jgi:hypothetical protein
MSQTLIPATEVSIDMQEEILLELNSWFSGAAREAIIASAINTFDEGIPLHIREEWDRDVVEEIFERHGIVLP